MQSKRFLSGLARPVRITSTKLLVASILLCVSAMAWFGYRELSRFSAENAELRLDRAAITAALLARHALPELQRWEPGERATPDRIILDIAAPEALKAMVPRFERLVGEVSQSNQGAANIFAWDAQTATFERIVTTLRKPDGSAPPAFRMTPEHPAYAAVSGGKAFRGDVPVAGRLRYAFLIPIHNLANQPMGIFAVDVGWSDDLMSAKRNLQTKLASMALIIGAVLLAAALASLRLIKAPLGAISALLNRSHGEHPDETLKWISGRGDEFENIARGIQKLRRKEAALQRQMGVDVLTGLGNRKRFEEALEKIAAAPDQMSANQHVVLLDLDHFKQINDECGHPAGDAVLREVADSLRALLPAQVTICRNGGDEFALIGEIEHVEDKARAMIEAITKTIALEGESLRISASIGILRVESGDTNARDIYKMADQALYAAKRAGKGCFRIYDRAEQGTQNRKTG